MKSVLCGQGEKRYEQRLRVFGRHGGHDGNRLRRIEPRGVKTRDPAFHRPLGRQRSERRDEFGIAFLQTFVGAQTQNADVGGSVFYGPGDLRHGGAFSKKERGGEEVRRIVSAGGDFAQGNVIAGKAVGKIGGHSKAAHIVDSLNRSVAPHDEERPLVAVGVFESRAHARYERARTRVGHAPREAGASEEEVDLSRANRLLKFQNRVGTHDETLASEGALERFQRGVFQGIPCGGHGYGGETQPQNGGVFGGASGAAQEDEAERRRFHREAEALQECRDTRHRVLPRLGSGQPPERIDDRDRKARNAATADTSRPKTAPMTPCWNSRLPPASTTCSGLSKL